MILKISKEALLSALIFQAKNDVRYYLNGICFEPDGNVFATDGHRLFIGKHETDKLKNQIIVKLENTPPKTFSYAEIDTKNLLAFFYSKEGIKLDVVLISIIDGKFPEVKKVIPSEFKPVDIIGFNTCYINDLNKAAKLYNPKTSHIIIRPNGNNQAAEIEIHRTAKVILMPTRLDG